MTLWNPGHINLLKLAGVTSVVGLDISDGILRAAQMDIRGGTFDRINSSFEASGYFTCTVDESRSASAVKTVRDEMERHGITARYAVAALQENNVKTVRTEITGDASNIDEWLQDNFEKIVKLPVPLSDLTYRYEILRKASPTFLVEFVFARASEVESIQNFVYSLNLELLAVSAGLRDCLNSVFYSDRTMYGQTFSLIVDREDRAMLFDVDEGNLTASYSSSSRSGLPERQGRMILLAAGPARDGEEALKPFGIAGEYAIAAGLAIRGLLPGLNPMDFLQLKDSVTVMEHVSKGLFHRVLLTCGGILVGLLLLQSAFSLIIDRLKKDVDVKLMASGTGRSELAILEKQNTELRKQLALIGADSSRTEVARLLHDVAAVVPDGVYLYKLVITKSSSGTFDVVVSGYGGESGNIADFVRLLEETPGLRDVRIVRSGVPAYGENVSLVGRKILSPLTFTASAVWLR